MALARKGASPSRQAEPPTLLRQTQCARVAAASAAFPRLEGASCSNSPGVHCRKGCSAVVLRIVELALVSDEFISQSAFSSFRPAVTVKFPYICKRSVHLSH